MGKTSPANSNGAPSNQSLNRQIEVIERELANATCEWYLIPPKERDDKKDETEKLWSGIPQGCLGSDFGSRGCRVLVWRSWKYPPKELPSILTSGW